MISSILFEWTVFSWYEGSGSKITSIVRTFHILKYCSAS